MASPPARTGLWLSLVGLGALVGALAQTVLVPVIATLPDSLGTSSDNVQWLLTSTLLVAAVAVPTFSRMGDMFGTRRMLLVALGALVVGVLLAAVTSSVPVLIVARAIQGAAPAVIPLGISLLSGLLPREKAGTGIAIVSAMLGVGAALGQPLAGLVAEHLDFHALFWIMLGAGVVLFLGVLLLVPEAPNRSGGRLDLLGVVLLAGALVALLLPLSQASSWGWGSARVLGLLAGAVMLLALFGWRETRVRSPLVDLAALRRRPIVITNVASLFFGFALFASLIGTVSYVQAPPASSYGFGSSMLVGGLAMLPSGLCMLLLAPVAARLSARIGAPQTLALGGVVVAVGWLMRIVLTGSLWEVILGATVVGAGTGIGYAAMPSLIGAHTPQDELAAANGLNTLVRTIGSSLASALGGTIMAASTIILGAFVLPSLSAYRILFAVCGGAALVAAAAALFIPRQAKVS